MSTLFKNFVDFTNPLDKSTSNTLVLLSKIHPIFKNHETIKLILEDDTARISISQLVQLNETVLQHSYYLARKAGETASYEQPTLLLIIIEQNLLSTAAHTLSTAIAARMQNSVERLSKIAGLKA